MSYAGVSEMKRNVPQNNQDTNQSDKNQSEPKDSHKDSHKDDNDQYQVNIGVDASCNSDGVKQSIYMVFHSLMALFAIYLSWKCNNEQFDLSSFIIAILCPQLYVIYILATRGVCSNPVAKL